MNSIIESQVTLKEELGKQYDRKLTALVVNLLGANTPKKLKKFIGDSQIGTREDYVSTYYDLIQEGNHKIIRTNNY